MFPRLQKLYLKACYENHNAPETFTPPMLPLGKDAILKFLRASKRIQSVVFEGESPRQASVGHCHVHTKKRCVRQNKFQTFVCEYCSQFRSAPGYLANKP